MLRFSLLVAGVSLCASCFSDSGQVADSGGSAEGIDETGDGDGDGDGEGEGEGEGDGDGDGEGEGGETRWDTLLIPDAPPCGGPGDGGDPDFSYIWVSNSSQSTISKINTETLVEEGRYVTRPSQSGDPSRTSVNLSGDVAVANRNGGVTAFYARDENCQESNGMQGLQTSTDSSFLSWDVEECRSWYTPMNYSSQRPVAWTQGTWNNSACQYDDQKVWTSGSNAQIEVLLLDGDNGAVEDSVVIAGVDPAYYGIYGGAVDGDGNFWGSQLSIGMLVRVDRDDLSYDVWPMATDGYGMTVDSEGYVWTCSSEAARFDPETETWQTAFVGGCAGCMAETGEDGLLWMSSCQGIVGVDRHTLQVAKQCPDTNGSYGISIDFAGNVWAVAYGNSANRVDPETCQVQSYSGLVGAYTYSDMTGYALSHAGTPSG